ncbi:MAG: tellurium resistance protein [Cypionkella sp.]
MTADRRPPRFPAPQFPVKRAKLFATTPPSVFTVILGLLGLGLALRRACAVLGLPGGLVELILGALLALWLFAIVALKLKVLRRFSVLAEDMRPLPGRAGLAAATMSGMLAAGVLIPYAPRLALFLVLASLAAHAILTAVLLRVLMFEPEGRIVNPTWHLSFVGFIVAAPVLAQLGWTQSAKVIFALTFLAAMLIWLMSLVQLSRHAPPAPLRPMLAIHLSAASLLSSTASLTEQPDMALALTAFSVLIALALIFGASWLLAAGFTPIWGAMTFPLAAFSTALMVLGGTPATMGALVALAALAVIPPISWRVLKLWPGGKLAAKTNAATA